MREPRLSRRELLAAAAAAAAALALRDPSAAGAADWSGGLDFGSAGFGDGWPKWRCPGVANLRRADGLGLLEAGSDVFPNDPRPVAFAVDRRLRDGEIAASVEAAGAGVGLVLRRTGPRDYYAAIYDDEQAALLIVRRTRTGLTELARTPVARPAGSFRLAFTASGARPTALAAALDAGGASPATVSASDPDAALAGAGDPGVLATARTLFPAEGPAVLPALGNLHLLPYGVQEGQAVLGSPAGEGVIGAIRERSTAVFARIQIRAPERPRATAASVVAATSGTPVARGATLRVAADVPADVEIEVAERQDFKRSRRIRVSRTKGFDAAFATVTGLRPGRRVHWRARLRRRGLETVGPTRSFRVLPKAGSGKPARVAIGSCASQFGPIFDELARREPDVFLWQGDLNYPDTVGPLAQTLPGYAGIWRDFLANPRLAPTLERSMFATQRDDHDYGLQDANATNLVPWGLAPWDALMEPRAYHRFTAGLAEFWILDQRLHKSDPALPDTPDKTLLGAAQRDWLLRTLAASRAPFKVVCSPCTLAPLSANARDGSWATGFTAERDLILGHVAERVSGRTVFVTGDTHWTMAYERDGLLEVRPCPLGIPAPNDITLTQPNVAEDARAMPGVSYADDERGHFALVEVAARGGRARLDLTLVRDDGETPYRTELEAPLPS